MCDRGVCLRPRAGAGEQEAGVTLQAGVTVAEGHAAPLLAAEVTHPVSAQRLPPSVLHAAPRVWSIVWRCVCVCHSARVDVAVPAAPFTLHRKSH